MCLAPERRSKQAIDLVPHLLAWQAVVELELDETDEQRIERAPDGQKLLRELGKRLGAGDHAGERANLAARALGVAGGCGPLADGVE